MTMEFVGNVVLPDRILYGGKVVCRDGRIESIEPGKEEGPETLPFILPGLVDMHHHGALGHDYMEASDEAFRIISRHLVCHGVTAGLCTTISASEEEILKVLNFYRSWQKKADNYPGCQFYGLHLEGPFLAKESRGAHPLEALREPKDGYDFLLENRDIIRRVTLAPELEGMEEMIPDLVKSGIRVSGGHDKAEPGHIEKAISSGMDHCTHIYCAMSTLHKTDGHRQCGLCEYGMTEPSLTAEIIADNHHIPPKLAQIIYHCKGPEKLCIVSDSISPAGYPESNEVYRLGDGENCTKVFVEGGVAMVEDKSCYAGSIQMLDQMIRNLVWDAKIPLVDVVRMASLTPAQIVGIDGECGSLTPGKRADICVMSPELSVIKTVVSGKTVYEKDKDGGKINEY